VALKYSVLTRREGEKPIVLMRIPNRDLMDNTDLQDFALQNTGILLRKKHTHCQNAAPIKNAAQTK
jgi:hypothetical protein